MTHIIAKTLTNRFAGIRLARPRLALRRPDFQPLGISATVIKLVQIVAEAYVLAYAVPFGLRHIPPQHSGETEEGGRDPNW